MSHAKSIKSALSFAVLQLNTEESTLDAQLLLQHLLNVNRAWLIAHENDALPPDMFAAYRALVNRRLIGEPIAYILGVREFYGLKLKVTPATLIPRADTETLVDAALTKIPLQKNLTICDLGTGTGAIALAIAKHRPHALVTAIDASEDALDVAKENARNLTINNVTFYHSDWFGALNHRVFDVIVSNPPYIEATDTHLQQGDLRFEPRSALASGQEGLDAIRYIIKQAPPYLKPRGWLMLEHGYRQAESVTALLRQAGFDFIDTIKDLGGNDRVTLGRISTH